MNKSDIQAWETENAETVVWGTHDPVAAYPVARAFYEEISEVPEDLREAISDEALLYWADPSMIEEEVWPDSAWSSGPVEGWIPYMVVSW